MLRVSIIDIPGEGLTLRIEGQVAGPWVVEIQRACEQHLAAGRRLFLDLRAVSFADQDGIALLQNLTSRQVGLVNCSPFLTEALKAA